MRRAFKHAMDRLHELCRIVGVGVSEHNFQRAPVHFYKDEVAHAIICPDAVWLPGRERFCFMEPHPKLLAWGGLKKLEEWDPERFSSDWSLSSTVFLFMGMTPPDEEVPYNFIFTKLGAQPEEVLDAVCERLRNDEEEARMLEAQKERLRRRFS